MRFYIVIMLYPKEGGRVVRNLRDLHERMHAAGREDRRLLRGRSSFELRIKPMIINSFFMFRLPFLGPLFNFHRFKFLRSTGPSRHVLIVGD